MLASSAQAACNVINGVGYGDCAGVTINTRKDSFRTVDRYESISGISAGAHVIAGGNLYVSGMAEHVVVDTSGSVRVAGTVNRLEVSGDAHVSGSVNTIILRNGGQVTVEGIVGAILGEGHATLIEGSVVSGRPTLVTADLFYSR